MRAVSKLSYIFELLKKNGKKLSATDIPIWNKKKKISEIASHASRTQCGDVFSAFHHSLWKSEGCVQLISHGDDSLMGNFSLCFGTFENPFSIGAEQSTRFFVQSFIVDRDHWIFTNNWWIVDLSTIFYLGNPEKLCLMLFICF